MLSRYKMPEMTSVKSQKVKHKPPLTFIVATRYENWTLGYSWKLLDGVFFSFHTVMN